MIIISDEEEALVYTTGVDAMLLSIIVPAYNVENYIKNCVNSLLNQNTDDYEIVVVNDGSTDKTPEII